MSSKLLMTTVTWAVVAFGAGTASALPPLDSPYERFPELTFGGLEWFAGPDMTIGLVGASVARWGVIDGVGGYTFGMTHCNVGTAPAGFEFGTNAHPVVAQALYRLRNGRMEQIGLSWVFHGFCALQSATCMTCTPACGGCCNQLGAGCSTPDTASIVGQQTLLGPRSEVNPATGEFDFPFGLGFGQMGNSIYKRLQVRQSDLDPAMNPTARYFAEITVVSRDDTVAGNQLNNVSHRGVGVGPPTAGQFTLAFNLPNTEQRPALLAWQDLDPGVRVEFVDVPGDGRLMLASKVTVAGDNKWHYEYALYNLNSARAAAQFVVPILPGVRVSDLGFHDVDYHSGEPYALTDWVPVTTGDAVRWSTESFDQNPDANALRWGTTYNFRFEANAPPAAADLTVTLFTPGSPTSVTIPAVAPLVNCAADSVSPQFDHDRMCAEQGANVVFSGYLDPRRESLDGVHVSQGLQTFDVLFTEPVFDPDTAEGGAFNVGPGAFTVAQTGPGPIPIVTQAVVDAADPTRVRITLHHPIALQEWTTLIADVQDACGNRIDDSLGNQGAGVVEPARFDLGFLPCDIDQNGLVQPVDLLRFRQMLSDGFNNACGGNVQYIDTDRSGAVNPLDLLRFRQLLSGTTPATQAWAGQAMHHPQP